MTAVRKARLKLLLTRRKNGIENDTLVLLRKPQKLRGKGRIPVPVLQSDGSHLVHHNVAHIFHVGVSLSAKRKR